MGRRTFFRYFPTKLDVVLGELDDGLAALVSTLRALPADVDPVAAARQAFLQVNAYADDDVPLLRRRLGLIETVPELAARAAVRYDAWERAVARDAAARWGCGVGALRPQVFARVVVAAMRGVFTTWLATPGADGEALRALAAEAFDDLGRGFAAPGVHGMTPRDDVRVTDPVSLIDVDPDSSVAPYEQVRASVTSLVRSGQLAPHTRLPAVRRLAVDLGLAANTVARAYRELEAAGVVETRGRLGTFVVDPASSSGGGRDEAREAARGVRGPDAGAGRLAGAGAGPGPRGPGRRVGRRAVSRDQQALGGVGRAR